MLYLLIVLVEVLAPIGGISREAELGCVRSLPCGMAHRRGVPPRYASPFVVVVKVYLAFCAVEVVVVRSTVFEAVLGIEYLHHS